MTSSNDLPNLQPKVVLVAAAHPDDMDFGAAGTLALFAEQGADIYYLQLTDGAAGTADTSIEPAELQKIREDEQRQACKLVGGKDCIFLGYPDGHLAVTEQLKKDIVRVIRRVQPDVVITTDPTLVYNTDMGIINHSDHRAAGQAVLDAVYPLSRDHLSYPDLLEEGLKPHKVKTVLMHNFSGQNYFVDVSDVLETKLAAAWAHASQMNETMADLFKMHAKTLGEHAGYDYAEAFIRLDIGF